MTPLRSIDETDLHLSYVLVVFLDHPQRAIESLGINTQTVDFTTWWQEYLQV